MIKSSLFFSLVTILIVFGAVQKLKAQDQQKSHESISVNVSAKVMEASIELITLRNIQFTNAQPSQHTLDISPVSDDRAGLMKAMGRPNAPIRVSFQNRWEVNNSSGRGRLVFNYKIAGNTENVQSTSELLNYDNRDLNFNSDGEFFFWIGGNVDISQALPGKYQGEFTIEVEYI